MATWANWVGDYRVSGLRRHRPANLDRLRKAMKGVGPHESVRAVGAGHAMSEVAQPRDVVIDVSRMQRRLPELEECLKPPPPGGGTGVQFYAVEAGCSIAALDAKLQLEHNHFALPSIPGYDGLSLFGATCTASHGSGSTIGPMSDFVAGVVFATSNGGMLQIEPSLGITDPAKFDKKHKNKGWRLVQDDDVFYSVVVSMGCMGVVYALIYKVVPAHWLRETRILSTWGEVKERIEDDAFSHRHYEAWISPYNLKSGASADSNSALVIIRDPVPEPASAPGHAVRPRGGRNIIPALLSELPTGLVASYLRSHADEMPKIIHDALDLLQVPASRPYVDRSDKIQVQDVGNNVEVIASDTALSLGSYRAATEELLAITARAQARGDFLHSSPISLRFVKGSRHFLAMQYHPLETPCCMLEIITVKGIRSQSTIRGYFRQLEAMLRTHGGRPHWGQVNFMNQEQTRAAYPKFDKWLEVYRKMNDAGLYDNAFTDRLAISQRPL